MNTPIPNDLAETKVSATQQFQVRGRDETESAKKPGAISPRLLQAAAEQAPVSLVIADADGVVQYANPLFCASYNCPVNVASGQPLRKILEGHFGPGQFSSMWATVTAGKIWENEFQLAPTAGNPRWVKVLFRPVLDQQPSGERGGH